MNDYLENVKSTFGNFASLYLEKFGNLSELNDTIAFLVSNGKTDAPKILDLACGPGNLSRLLLETWPKAELTGIDIAPEMIKIATEINPTGHFFTHDILDLPAFDARFDLICCGYGLPYITLEQCQKLMEKINCLLQPKGLLLLSFMEGDYKESTMVYSSTEPSRGIFTHLYNEQKIAEIASANNLSICYSQRINFSTEQRPWKNDLLLIIKKN